jgi:hypothetical protein
VPPAAATTSPDLKRISACGVGENVLRRRVSIALTALWRYNLNDHIAHDSVRLVSKIYSFDE